MAYYREYWTQLRNGNFQAFQQIVAASVDKGETCECHPNRPAKWVVSGMQLCNACFNSSDVRCEYCYHRRAGKYSVDDTSCVTVDPKRTITCECDRCYAQTVIRLLDNDDAEAVFIQFPPHHFEMA